MYRKGREWKRKALVRSVMRMRSVQTSAPLGLNGNMTKPTTEWGEGFTSLGRATIEEHGVEWFAENDYDDGVYERVDDLKIGEAANLSSYGACGTRLHSTIRIQ